RSQHCNRRRPAMSLPHHSEYKDCGVEWPEEVPKYWKILKLRRCLFVAEGQVNPEYSPYKEMVLIAPNHIESNTGKIILLETAEEQGAESGKYLCQEGDVIYCKIRPALRKVCIAPQDCLCSADMYPLRPLKLLFNRFLFWFLLSEQFSTRAILESDRVAMPKINRESLKELSIAFPPIEEQTSIAAFLDFETASLSALIAEQERLIELLKEKRQAVISHAVTKGLDPDVPMKDSGIEWLGEVPEHWEVKRLKFLCKVQTGDKDTVNAVVDGAYPFFVRSQTIEKIDTFTFDCEAVLTAGDGVGVGKVFHYVDGKFDFHQRVYMMNQFRFVTGKFFFWYLASTFHKVALEGGAKSTVDSLRMPLFLNFAFALPPKLEQEQIICFIECETAKIDELIAEAHRAIELLKERRSALISAAVTGQIDVRDWTKPEATP
ncbi:MAG: restriction endonuclease subunit S, partial [Blastocatellia bacterium]|nr:restriction endonuclease subunit S [Blastocatellia bacterium]